MIRADEENFLQNVVETNMSSKMSEEQPVVNSI
jgi:hypothetical protein